MKTRKIVREREREGCWLNSIGITSLDMSATQAQHELLNDERREKEMIAETENGEKLRDGIVSRDSNEVPR